MLLFCKIELELEMFVLMKYQDFVQFFFICNDVSIILLNSKVFSGAHLQISSLYIYSMPIQLAFDVHGIMRQLEDISVHLIT